MVRWSILVWLSTLSCTKFIFALGPKQPKTGKSVSSLVGSNGGCLVSPGRGIKLATLWLPDYCSDLLTLCHPMFPTCFVSDLFTLAFPCCFSASSDPTKQSHANTVHLLCDAIRSEALFPTVKYLKRWGLESYASAKYFTAFAVVQSQDFRGVFNSCCCETVFFLMFVKCRWKTWANRRLMLEGDQVVHWQTR